ncbi:MAG: DNA topoisomerase IV subunit A [Phycisphaerae bacterium]|nr:DNA topoisomerase IV subunit A [Phycisphaerae bacterium]
MSKSRQGLLFPEEANPGEKSKPASAKASRPKAKPEPSPKPEREPETPAVETQGQIESAEPCAAVALAGGETPPPASHDRAGGHERHGPLTDMMDYNFLQYASYVICERAIPNVADGLKPVQRRILHALHERDDGRFVKVANVVGQTMQYHPHGDASIGEALVTLANKRYLIEGQGNFGNVFTGDAAAAPRYIECRLTDLAREHLFNDELTEMIPSYDGRKQEPVTLPSKLPLLLMLGAEGIAVGLSTSILPHNFIELLEAQIQIIQEKRAAPARINVLPDFQTGGTMDVSEYDKGFGKVKVRARIEKKDANRLILRELPYAQTTESVIDSIEDAVKRKKVPVRAINDFTAEHVEIELILSQGADQDKAIKALYAFTRCETSVASRIIVIHNRRPVEMNTEQVLRENTRQLLDLLQKELELKRHKLLEALQAKTLIQIFVENRIYKRIEECKTYEAVVAAVFKGLEPFRRKLRRDVTQEDVEMLLEVRIKRISRFDIDKNRKDIEEILDELARVEKYLKHPKAYAVSYLQAIIAKHKKAFPRLTQTGTLKALDVRTLTANELTICIDREKGFLGHDVKGEELLKCSSLDKLLIVKADGTFTVMPPPETVYVGDGLVWCGLYQRELAFTAVYSERKGTYLKRFEIGGAIMNRDYPYIPEGASLECCAPGTPELIYVKYKPAKGLRILQQTFKPEQVAIKGLKAKGRQLSTKAVARADTTPGRWWDKSIKSPMGELG